LDARSASATAESRRWSPVEKTSRGYVITAELVDPADGAVVASVTETAATTVTVLPTVTREAQRLRELFGKRRAGIKGAPRVQQVSTTSLAALQLHDEALRVYWSHGRAEEAEPINRRARGSRLPPPIPSTGRSRTSDGPLSPPRLEVPKPPDRC
jgi:hypothetical protein